MSKYTSYTSRIKQEKPVVPVIKAQAKFASLKRYFVMAMGADRVIERIGKAPKGVWVEVPKKVYDSIGNSKVFARKEE